MLQHRLPIDKKIFISIPSYEDELLLETINDALLKAKNASRLTFGVALQYKKIDKPDLSFLGNQLKLIEYDVDSRPGIIEIRKNIADLIEDEEYFLGIDAHTLFAQNWDQQYIDDHQMLIEKNGNSKVCIASRINGSESDFKKDLYSEYLDTRWILDINKNNVYETWWDWPVDVKNRLYDTPEYVKRYFVSANNWFTTSEFFINNLFWCFNKTVYEEPQISLSLFLNNYDVYLPTSKVLVIANPKSQTTNRENKIHWQNPSHKNWNHDSIEVVREVFKLFYTGKSNIFSLNRPDDIYKWWNAIGLYEKAKEVSDRLKTLHLDRTYYLD